MTTHAQLLGALLPAPYAKDGEVLAAELAAEGATLDAVLTHADTLLPEIDPALATALLARFEAWLGLPDPCTVSAGTPTLAARRTAAVARWNAEGGLSLAYYRQLCAAAGYATAVIEELADAWNWRVTVPDTALVSYFAAGTAAAGDPLRAWQTHPLTCLLKRAEPAHCRLWLAFDAEMDLPDDTDPELDAAFDALHLLIHTTYPAYFG